MTGLIAITEEFGNRVSRERGDGGRLGATVGSYVSVTAAICRGGVGAKGAGAVTVAALWLNVAAGGRLWKGDRRGGDGDSEGVETERWC